MTSPHPAPDSFTSAAARPTVMLLCTSLAQGGAEMQVTLLAKALHARGWPVHVTSLVEPTAFAQELDSAGIPVHSLAMRPGHRALRPDQWSLAGIARFAFLLRRHRPAILHAHLFHANLLARFARSLCPVPVVVSTIHSLAESSQRSARTGLRDLAYRLTDAYSSATVCVSHAVARRHREARAVSARALRVIGNAADIARFHPDPQARQAIRASLGLDDRFTWLAAGRLMWKKDYPTLLTAMALLGEGRLLIAGDGPLRTELEDRAAALGAEVTFLGLRTDVHRLMQACDGFVLSSVVEGLPTVLLEAALSALPCVATRAGGVPETFPDRQQSHLVPPQDAQSLAAAMRAVMAMPADARRACGEAFRAHALQHFSVDAITGQWEALYLELLAQAASEAQP